jgi:hypothetical protein
MQTLLEKLTRGMSPPERAADAWADWRESVKETKPTSYGFGVISDCGVNFKIPNGKWCSLWQSATGEPRMAERLTAEGVNATAAYRVRLRKGARFPGDKVMTNVSATRDLGWPTEIDLGCEVELFAWRAGEFTQIALRPKITIARTQA